MALAQSVGAVGSESPRNVEAPLPAERSAHVPGQDWAVAASCSAVIRCSLRWYMCESAAR